MFSNIYDCFAFTPANYNKPLIYLPNEEILSYRDIDERVAKYCNYFKVIGLKKRDRLVQQTEKCVDSLCIYLASLRYGTTYITLNTQYKEAEIFIKKKISRLIQMI